ncbi:hypothetical protein PHYC_03587 [Phycisphaerales bacterium]|nr:hypothetical protein PHYC_03587 [Phycisphaerales bacterium]
MSDSSWNRGDNVMHSAKPEWGAGEVLVAEPAIHEGKPCQRLTIRFSRAGTKILSTAFADLRRAIGPAPSAPAPDQETKPSTPAFASSNGSNPFAAPAPDDDYGALLAGLPDRATDPFQTLRSRLAATLDLYRFNDSGGSLLDWAAAQTGLKDPLSRFSRHELEQSFAKFRVEVDNHLRKLVRDMAKQDAQGLRELTAAAPPAATQAIRRLDPLR